MPNADPPSPSRWFEPPAFYGPAGAAIVGVLFLALGVSAGYTGHCPSPCSSANCSVPASCYRSLSLGGSVLLFLGAGLLIGSVCLATLGAILRRRHPRPLP